jgi:ribosomal protein S27AE
MGSIDGGRLTRAGLLGHAASLAWTGFAVVAAGGWYLTATRLTYRFGPDEAAQGVGLLVALAVGLTVWRWGREDRRSATLAAGLCPRCGKGVGVRHEHGMAGRAGVTRWACSECGYDHTEPLTCEACRP